MHATSRQTAVLTRAASPPLVYNICTSIHGNWQFGQVISRGWVHGATIRRRSGPKYCIIHRKVARSDEPSWAERSALERNDCLRRMSNHPNHYAGIPSHPNHVTYFSRPTPSYRPYVLYVLIIKMIFGNWPFQNRTPVLETFNSIFQVFLSSRKILQLHFHILQCWCSIFERMQHLPYSSRFWNYWSLPCSYSLPHSIMIIVPSIIVLIYRSTQTNTTSNVTSNQ